ncbi:hypothetical protein H7X87_01460 [Acetobacteraceae bacterium]|nr:hypothetical protein [Candidatus Parcubacteria bacterium]
MAHLRRAERELLARKRIIKVLTTQKVANMRTLEQKISDAGPGNMRVDPHILTPIRKNMVAEGRVISIRRNNIDWYALPETNSGQVEYKLRELSLIYRELNNQDLKLRMGQTLEIATYRALLNDPDTVFFGRFLDLGNYNDSTLYSKEEPPNHIGRRAMHGRVDFMVIHPAAGALVIECKNSREWLYPDREEIRSLLKKAIAINAVPVLVARRIPFITFRVLQNCGVILHQVYNQLLPVSAQSVADRAAHKNLLGYHDIRTGNIPDARMTKFITVNLSAVATEARSKFEENRDVITRFTNGSLRYSGFVQEVLRYPHEREDDDPADWFD